MPKEKKKTVTVYSRGHMGPLEQKYSVVVSVPIIICRISGASINMLDMGKRFQLQGAFSGAKMMGSLNFINCKIVLGPDIRKLFKTVL